MTLAEMSNQSWPSLIDRRITHMKCVLHTNVKNLDVNVGKTVHLLHPDPYSCYDLHSVSLAHTQHSPNSARLSGISQLALLTRSVPILTF